MKRHKTNFNASFILIVVLFSLAVTNCKQKDIENSLNLNCNNRAISTNTTAIKDIKNTFQLEIPASWRRQLYVDQYASKLHCADTVKELNDTYIFNLSWQEGELTLDSLFTHGLKLNALQRNESKIISTKSFTTRNKPSYSIYSKYNSNGVLTHDMQLYITNKDNSFYRLSVLIFGYEQIEERLCEALNIFKTCKLLK